MLKLESPIRADAIRSMRSLVPAQNASLATAGAGEAGSSRKRGLTFSFTTQPSFLFLFGPGLHPQPSSSFSFGLDSMCDAHFILISNACLPLFPCCSPECGWLREQPRFASITKPRMFMIALERSIVLRFALFGMHLDHMRL